MNLVSKERIEAAVERILDVIEGDDAQRAGLEETPKRVADAWEFWTQGYKQKPEDVLKEFEDGADNYDEMVFQNGIPLFSQCEHHLAPFFGVAHIGYIPNGKIVGLSKLARLVEVFARRLQVQERLTTQIADALKDTLGAKAVGVVIRCRHLCYSEDTEVLTDTGFKLFSSLTTMDKVAQYDNGVIEFVRPTSYVAEKYSGPMIWWYKKNLDMLVTPDHRCLVATEWKFRQKRSYEFIKAQDANHGTYFMPMAGIYTPTANRRSYNIAGFKLSEEQYCGLLGLYLAEGSFRFRPDPPRRDYRVAISQHHDTSDFPLIQQFLGTLPIPFKERCQVAGGPTTLFCASGRGLAEYFSQFGKSADKFIPYDIFHASLKGRRKFIEMYMAGDGWYQPESCQMGSSSRSKRLSEGIQQLWVTSGYGCRLVELQAQGKPQYVVRPRVRDGMLPKDYSSVSKHHREVVDYTGYVYCANVPSGALVVRRNGRVFISGNCMESRGVQKIGTLTYTSALRGFFKEDAAARGEFMHFVSLADARTVI